MSDDYIKREDAAKILLQRREFADNQDWTQEVDLMDLLCERFDDIPAADVVERKRARWEFRTVDVMMLDGVTSKIDVVQCTNCGKNAEYKSRFCPNCGADCRGDNGGE